MISIKKNSSFYVLMMLIFIASSCRKTEKSDFVIKEGEFIQTITETGELAAVNEKTFVLPRYGKYWYRMKIIGMLDHGSIVNPGDSVMQFDPSEIKKFIVGRESELERQKANLEKIIVQIQNQKSDLNSSLRSEQATFDLKKLELEQYRFESDKTKKIKKLEFQQAQIRLAKVKRNIELNKIISEKKMQIQRIQVLRIQDEVENAYSVLPKLTIRTSIPGIFQIARKRRSRELIAIGDEVYVGNKLGSVPDLTWMKVNTVVNEADFMKLSIGQKVNVKLDALDNVFFDGEISFISKLCRPIESDSRQKIFDVEVKIKVSDERLKPGMTVSCEYVCAHLNKVLNVPVQCVGSIGDKHFIYLKKGSSFVKKEVNVGPSNNSQIVIEGDISKGQELVSLKEVKQTQNN